MRKEFKEFKNLRSLFLLICFNLLVFAHSASSHSQTSSDKTTACKAPASWIDMLEQVKQLDEKEEQLIFGEALPPGLKLIDLP